MKYTTNITATKIGRPSTRLVTTRSIFSDMLSRLGAFLTHAPMTSAIQS